MFWSHVLLGVVWVLYCVLHSVLASLSAKNFLRSKMGKAGRHYRLAYTIFAGLGLAAIVWFQLSVPWLRLFQTSPFTLAAGSLVTAAGLAIMAVCVKKYFLNLSGLRSLAQERPVAVLEISGIHRYVRHPLYAGTFVFIWGLLLLLPTLSLLVADFIITVYTLIGIRLEEKKLVLEFGESYKAYQNAVPKLIPSFGPGESNLRPRRQKQTVRR